MRQSTQALLHTYVGAILSSWLVSKDTARELAGLAPSQKCIYRNHGKVRVGWNRLWLPERLPVGNENAMPAYWKIPAVLCMHNNLFLLC